MSSNLYSKVAELNKIFYKTREVSRLYLALSPQSLKIISTWSVLGQSLQTPLANKSYRIAVCLKPYQRLLATPSGLMLLIQLYFLNL